VKVLLISGSVRSGSSNTALLMTAQRVAPAGVAMVLYEGLETLPYFNPDLDRDPVPDPVRGLRGHVHDADAILLCTPEYAGALPGVFKNLLEWLIGDAEPGSISHKPVASINISAGPTGARDAHESLAKVLGFAGADFRVRAAIPVHRHMIDADGLIGDHDVRQRVRDVIATMLAPAGR
jgi:chromate reductase, NAD(P)H dehydrogenase (quinone)